MCGFAGALFYLDRQTLSVLKTTLKTELSWTDVDYGWLVSTFMLSYTACYLFTGRLIDRWGTRLSMPTFVGVMSAATLLTAIARNLGEMGACRALLGLAEAGVMPATMVAIFRWFPPERRGVASTIKEPLYVLGQVLATPLTAAVTLAWNWHLAFVLPGILGFMVAAAWWLTDRSPVMVAQREAAPTQPTSYREALAQRNIWGVILARLISDPLWFFFIYWEPGFLQERLGMSLGELARIGWIPTAVGTGTLLLLGMLSDWTVVRFGWTPSHSRRRILQCAAIFSPLVLVLPMLHNHALAIMVLCLARVMMVVWLNFTNLYMADLVPQSLIATSVALMSAFGAATGLLCNAIVGPVLENVGYGAVFAVGACLHPAAAFVLWRFYGRRQ